MAETKGKRYGFVARLHARPAQREEATKLFTLREEYKVLEKQKKTEAAFDVIISGLVGGLAPFIIRGEISAELGTRILDAMVIALCASAVKVP